MLRTNNNRQPPQPNSLEQPIINATITIQENNQPQNNNQNQQNPMNFLSGAMQSGGFNFANLFRPQGNQNNNNQPQQPPPQPLSTSNTQPANQPQQAPPSQPPPNQ